MGPSHFFRLKVLGSGEEALVCSLSEDTFWAPQLITWGMRKHLPLESLQLPKLAAAGHGEAGSPPDSL